MEVIQDLIDQISAPITVHALIAPTSMEVMRDLSDPVPNPTAQDLVALPLMGVIQDLADQAVGSTAHALAAQLDHRHPRLLLLPFNFLCLSSDLMSYSHL